MRQVYVFPLLLLVVTVLHCGSVVVIPEGPLDGGSVVVIPEGPLDGGDGKICRAGVREDCQTGKPGLCAVGQRICQSDGKAWGECIPQVSPSAEVCDGLDNDCNGQIDDGLAARPCYLYDTGCEEKADGSYVCKGACRTGLRMCQRGVWGACVGSVGPTQESCAGPARDEDCDGQIDEADACACVVGDSKPCGSDVGECRQGKMTCHVLGAYGACEGENKATAEVCDGKDNDCDGLVDEDWPDKGKACTVGVGECQQSGVFVCAADGKGLHCEGQPGTPQVEICDGKDNDCDGKIDVRPCYPEQTAGCSLVGGVWQCIGTCKTGEQSCVNGQWATTCQMPTVPDVRDECHDQLDNDCDGLVDEGCCTPSTLLYHTTLPVTVPNIPGIWRPLPIHPNLDVVVSTYDSPVNRNVVKLYRPSDGSFVSAVYAPPGYKYGNQVLDVYLRSETGVFDPTGAMMAFEAGSIADFTPNANPGLPYKEVDDAVVVILDLKSNAILKYLKAPYKRSYGGSQVVFSADGSLCMLLQLGEQDPSQKTSDILATVWRVSDETVLHSWRFQRTDARMLSSIFTAAEFHPMKNSIFVGVGEVMLELRLSDGRLLRMWADQPGAAITSILDVQFHPHKDELAIVSLRADRSAIRELSSGRLLHLLLPNLVHSYTRSVGRYSPNGGWLAIYAREVGLRLINTHGYTQHVLLHPPVMPQQTSDHGVQWSRDSKTVLIRKNNEIWAWKCP